MMIFTAKVAMQESLEPQATAEQEQGTGQMQTLLKLSVQIRLLMLLSLREMKRILQLASVVRGKHMKWSESCQNTQPGTTNVFAARNAPNLSRILIMCMRARIKKFTVRAVSRKPSQ